MQVQLSKICRMAVSAVLASSLMLVGCTVDGSVSAGASVNTQTGATTVTVTGTVTFHHKLLQQFAVWIPPVTGSDLALIDPSQAILSYSLSNAAISSTNGSFTITLTDGTTGAVVGQQVFQYVVNGNGLFAQDPTAVSNWLNQFTSNGNLDATVVANTDMQAISAGTATVTNNAVYQGVTYASATASWVRGTIGGGCHTPRCPVQ